MNDDKRYEAAMRSLGSMVIERNLWRKACRYLASHIAIDGSEFDIEQVVLAAYKFALKERKKEIDGE